MVAAGCSREPGPGAHWLLLPSSGPGEEHGCSTCYVAACIPTFGYARTLSATCGERYLRCSQILGCTWPIAMPGAQAAGAAVRKCTGLRQSEGKLNPCERERERESGQRCAMQFRDEFMPSGSEDGSADEFGSGGETFEDMLELEDCEGAGGDDDDEVQLVLPGGDEEVQFVPPGGSVPAPAPAAARRQAPARRQPPAKRAAMAGATALEGTSDIVRSRTLQRLTSNPKPPEPAAMEMLCIFGKPLKYPVPVHPVKIDSQGNRWFILNEHQTWLRRACAREGTTHYEVHFQAAVTALRENLQDLILEERKKESAAGQQDNIRKDLGISDSDEEPLRPRKRGKSSKAPKPGEQFSKKNRLEIPFCGGTLGVLNQLRPCCVECTAPAVSAILKACKQKADEHAAAPPKLSAAAASKKARKEKQEAPSAPTPAEATAAPAGASVSQAGSSDSKVYSMQSLSCGIAGKVTWQPSAQAWAVHYKAGNGKRAVQRVYAKGRVQQGFFGLQKSEPNSERIAALREVAFRQACELWNELDTTKVARIDLEDSGAL